MKRIMNQRRVKSPYPRVQKQVVWFDVSVNEAQLVNGIDGQDCLSDVKLSCLFAQSVFLHQQGHHIACRQQFQMLRSAFPTSSPREQPHPLELPADLWTNQSACWTILAASS